jgi:transcriptional regulator with XRE-family HTH domain
MAHILASFSNNASLTSNSIAGMSIHQRIKAGRMRLKMTEQQFADQLGVSRGNIYQWEKEGGTAPSRKRQADVARLIGLSVAELVSGEDAPQEVAPLPTPQEKEIPGDLALLVRWIDSIDNAPLRNTVIQECMRAYLSLTRAGRNQPTPDTGETESPQIPSAAPRVSQDH